MNILISSELHENTLRSYINIAKTFVHCGHDAIVWNPKVKSAYDIWDDFKPELYISNKVSDTERLLINEYGTKHHYANGSIFADIFLYRPVKPDKFQLDIFGCDNCAIINGPREEIKSIVESGILDVHSDENTKLFSHHRYMYRQYCQGLPEDLFPIALASAKRAHATNFLNWFNFLLVNKNSVYNINPPDITQETVLGKYTCFHGAQEISEACNLDIDFMAAYDKFMETYYDLC